MIRSLAALLVVMLALGLVLWGLSAPLGVTTSSGAAAAAPPEEALLMPVVSFLLLLAMAAVAIWFIVRLVSIFRAP